MPAPKLATVPRLDAPEPHVIEKLRDLLKRAEAGEVRAVAVAYELTGGDAGHWASFGKCTNRTQMVGKLHVLATHIVLNECLEWRPGS